MYPFWFFFDAINSMAEEKKLDRNDPLKLVIKLQWASFFLESLIMIDDRMNKKRRKLIGALFDKLCLAAAAFIVNVVRYDGWICCLLRQPIKLKWASFFLKSSIMIDDRINKKRMKLIGALFDKFWLTKNLPATSSHVVDEMMLFVSCCCCSTNKAPMSFNLFKIIDHD